jgi:hypothetical protein
VFQVPRNFVKVLDQDLRLAGIPKRDAAGRVVDVHSLRHTFCSHLSKGGVALRTAQAAMRHSDPKLTANTYTDPELLDVAGALDALPLLPLDAGPPRERMAAIATGTDDRQLNQFAPAFAPTKCKRVQTGTSAVKSTGDAKSDPRRERITVSVGRDKRNNPLTIAVSGLHKERETGLEPATSSLGS